jgi:hypothetical protein
MERTGTGLKKVLIRVITSFLLLLLFASAGCSIFKSSPESSPVNAERTIWHSRESNVRIVKQDGTRGGTFLKNDQPIVLDSGQIRTALAALEVRLPGSDKTIPVFTGPELDTLCPRLSEGLSLAGPDQDVTFVIVGLRKALFGLAKQRMVTTGRVFYRDGKLNIIFGKMVADLVNEGSTIEHDYQAMNDYRLNGLIPGSRLSPVSHNWSLEEVPYMQFYAENGMYRTDWIILDLASMAAHEALGIKPAKTVGTVSETPASVREKANTPQETRQVQTPAYQAPVVTQAPQTGKTSKTIEERLLILNDLKNKKLITDEEYKKKRAEILNDL